MSEAEQLGLGGVPCGFLAAAWNLQARPPRAESDIIHVDQRFGFMSCHRTSSRVASGSLWCGEWHRAGQGWPRRCACPHVTVQRTDQARRRCLCWGDEAEALSAGQPGLPRWALSATQSILPAGGGAGAYPAERRATQSHSRAPCGGLALKMGVTRPTAQGRQPPPEAGRDPSRSPQASRGGTALPDALISAPNTDSGLSRDDSGRINALF